jgi:hypothetical protein
MVTERPLPTLAGQSPGRGEINAEGGGGGAGGLATTPGAADDDPQLVVAAPRPIAIIVLSIAELPAARPIAVRKSRLARRFLFTAIAMLFGKPIRPLTRDYRRLLRTKLDPQ